MLRLTTAFAALRPSYRSLNIRREETVVHQVSWSYAYTAICNFHADDSDILTQRPVERRRVF